MRPEIVLMDVGHSDHIPRPWLRILLKRISFVRIPVLMPDMKGESVRFPATFLLLLVDPFHFHTASASLTTSGCISPAFYTRMFALFASEYISRHIK